MDSGNTGSLQSSSCGEDDFDTALFHPSSTSAATGAGGATDSPVPPPPSYSYHQLLDSFYFDNPSLLPLGTTATPWPHRSILRPSPNCTTDTFPSLSIPPSSNNSAPSSSRSTIGFSPLSSAQPQEQSSTAGTPTTATAPAPPSARSSKKRARASRRAPTTVLTTDTSNFRAMVQEFTGIPSPPLAGSASPSPFVHWRLDAIHSSAGGLTVPSSYLIRPFAQKFQGPFTSASSATINPMSPPASSTGMIAGIGGTYIANTNATSLPMRTSYVVNPTNSNNYQIPSPGPCQSTLSFQPFQQSQLRAKPSLSLPFSSSVFQTMPSSTEYASSNLLFPPGFLRGSSEGLGVRSSWNDCPALESIDRTQPQSVAVGDYLGSSQEHSVSSTCKMSFSASEVTAVDKAAENAKGSRSECLVESWICSD